MLGICLVWLIQNKILNGLCKVLYSFFSILITICWYILKKKKERCFQKLRTVWDMTKNDFNNKNN